MSLETVRELRLVWSKRIECRLFAIKLPFRFFLHALLQSCPHPVLSPDDHPVPFLFSCIPMRAPRTLEGPTLETAVAWKCEWGNPRPNNTLSFPFVLTPGLAYKSLMAWRNSASGEVWPGVCAVIVWYSWGCVDLPGRYLMTSASERRPHTPWYLIWLHQDYKWYTILTKPSTAECCGSRTSLYISRTWSTSTRHTRHWLQQNKRQGNTHLSRR